MTCPPTLRFLAISNNSHFLKILEDGGTTGNYAVETVKTGAQGFKAVIAARPDLVFLDAATPDMDPSSWLGILRDMREGKDLPVIITGEKLGHEEVASYFELGADDCVSTRLCDPRELAARIRATLRRHAPPAEIPACSLTAGPICLDPGKHRCYVDGKEVSLRPREFELLEMLMKKAGRVLSRPYLLECVWGMASTANTRAVDVTTSRLRKALGPRAGAWIGSVDRFGYRFAEPS